LAVEPEYTLRVSKRAKYARLQISMLEGLVVVVPKGFDQRRIPALLEKKRNWIEKVSRQYATQRRLAPQDPIPGRIELRGIGEVWRVETRAGESQRVLERPGNRLCVPDGDIEDIQAAMRRWLRRKAHQYLKPWLRHLAEENSFEIKRIFIKSQRTRWGSCSEKKNINLNMKLLFLPEALVHYVMLHELCHTVYLNHSKKFWALVAAHEPRYAVRRKALRGAWKYVPIWVEG
jgi:predicted metal-dependent hydrolase